MSEDINPTSGFDLKYAGLSKEDSERLTKDIDGILKESIREPLEVLKDSVRKSVDELYNSLTINPWPDFLEQNGNDYEFLGAMADQIWNSMIKMKPSKLGEWKMRQLFESMSKNHPEELASICNDELIREVARLKESLEFERRVNSSRSF